MRKILFSVIFILTTMIGVASDNNHAAILLVDHTNIDGIPGETFTNRVTLTNSSDAVSTIRLTLTAPPAFRLLTHLPATLTMGPHSSRQLMLKFMIERTWNGAEGTVRIETVQQRDPTAKSAIQFVVVPNRNAPAVLSFSLLNESPFVVPGQDTLWVPVRFSNQGPQPRRVRVWLYSMPDGFRLPRTYAPLTIPTQHDTTIRIPCLTTNALARDRRYDLTLEMQDVPGDDATAAGPFLGSVVCRPVLLASAKRFTDRQLLGEAPFGVAVGVGKFGRAGLVNELRTWGEQAVGKGRLAYKLYFLNYADLNYRELRDTYIQYERNGFELHLGNLYDMHELPLIGVGVRVGTTIGRGARLDAWALRNQSNWLAGLFISGLGPFQATQPIADQTYSARLTGTLPLAGEARYELSSSYYQQARLERAGLLHYAAANWKPNDQSTLTLRVGNSYEYAPTHPDRPRLMGWAVGGSYARQTQPLDMQASAYMSSPVYGGIQRGATLLEHSITWRRWANARLGYRYSQVDYNQQLSTGPYELTTRRYGNTIAEVFWAQRFGRVSGLVRPYVWRQAQSLPSGVTQQANSYRMLLSLRYEARTGARLEAGIDAGRFDHLTPPTDRFQVRSLRYFGSLAYGNVALMGTYQQGPFLVNDYLPGQGNPASFRQLSVGPTAHVSMLGGRVRANLGAGLTYNSVAASWNGLIYNNLQYAASESLRFRLDVNALSYAARLGEMSAVPWQESQVRLEATKTFHRLPGQPSRTLRLRFFEDENNNQRRDGSETYLPDLVVNVNQTAMLTNAKGQLICKDIPRGTYQIQAVSKLTTGEPVWFQDTITVVSSVERELGIRKTWRTTGQLRCHRAKYDTQPCDLEQYRIETTGTAGELYRTYADELGQFALFLPVGTYQLIVIPVQNPAGQKRITHTVGAGGQPKPIQIDLDPSRRPVQIKRFGAR